MNVSDFKLGGKGTIAAFCNALSGTEDSSTVAAWVHANLKAQRPVDRDSPGLFESYDQMVVMINNYGPNITPADLDTAIAAWDGT